MAFFRRKPQKTALEADKNETKPTSKKMKHLIKSVRKHNLDEFKALLNTPNWYLTTDKKGNNLLHIAMSELNYEAFNHILSLDCFPLELKNKTGETALYSAMTEVDDEKHGSRSVDEYFAVELIKKGAHIHPMALHHAVSRSSVKMAHAVLERGLDPNFVEGNSPLQKVALDTFNIEMGALLLAWGADPLLEVSSGCKRGYSSLEIILLHCLNHEFNDMAVLYAIDEHTNLRLHLETLVQLGHRETRGEYLGLRPPIFPKIIDQVSEIVIDKFVLNHVVMLNSMEASRMRKLREKPCFPLIYFILSHDRIKDFLPFTISTQTSLHDFNEFIEEEFGCYFSDFVSEVNSNKFLIYLTSMDFDESSVTKILCHLLLHGLKCDQLGLQWIYMKYGYNELFKIMLHMDFDMKYDLTPFIGGHFYFVSDAVPLFIYDTSLNLETFLKAPENYVEGNVDKLSNYFVHRELTRYCREQAEDWGEKFEDGPQIPLLQQLARDSFRKHLINMYKIKTTRQFFSYVNCLQINNIYKKIITFESRLY